jgi:hypothetical protein
MKPTLFLKGMSGVVFALASFACSGEISGNTESGFLRTPTAESSVDQTAVRSSSLATDGRTRWWLANLWRRARTQPTVAPAPVEAPAVIPSPTAEEPVAAPEPTPPAVIPAPTPVSQPAPTVPASTPTPTTPVVEPGSFPGGFIEATSSTQVRAKLSASQLQSLLPAAGGKFTFPAPYHSEAIRLTDANSCGGRDCVRYVGYSYWRNINNHVGQDSMLIVVGLDSDAGGAGFSLLRYNKTTEKLDMLGPVFAGTRVATNVTGEDIYFSGTRPTIVYVAQGSELLRVDVLTKAVEVAFDAAPKYGSDTYLWQHHSSDDDLVHSASLRVESTGATLGCLVYREGSDEFRLFEPQGDFDECQVDRSGKWLIIKDNIDSAQGEDNRIIDLETGAETNLLDQQGAGGHSDLGYGVLVAEDNWNNLPGAVRAWGLGQSPLLGPVVYHESAWRSDGSSHISYTSARPSTVRARNSEVACQSTVARGQFNRGSEIFCYRLDGSLDVMVVAPVMTDLDAAGGGDDYAKSPKGNLDVTGRYFIWTSNAGGNRLDAFLVKIPSMLE